MSYDPRRRKRHDPSFRNQAARAMRLAHRSGISLKAAWGRIRSGRLDPKRSPRRMYRKSVHYGPRGGKYWRGPTKRRYDHLVRHRRSHRRRHDPLRLPSIGGKSGGVLSGVVGAASAVIGTMMGKYINAATPQVNFKIPGTNKAINVASFGVGALGSSFAPAGKGMVGQAAQGFFHGVAASSDPVASALGGGAVRPMGSAGNVGYYGSIGV